MYNSKFLRAQPCGLVIRLVLFVMSMSEEIEQLVEPEFILATSDLATL